MKILVIRNAFCFLDRVICATCVALCMQGGAIAQTTGSVTINLPQVLSTPVVPLQTTTDVQFALQAVEAFQLQIIAPVPGVTLSLINPNGSVVLNPGDASVTFQDGSILPTPVPGGVFL